ncbi:MAG: nickel insertion protein [Lachnospiraceae bacterium]
MSHLHLECYSGLTPPMLLSALLSLADSPAETLAHLNTLFPEGNKLIFTTESTALMTAGKVEAQCTYTSAALLPFLHQCRLSESVRNQALRILALLDTATAPTLATWEFYEAAPASGLQMIAILSLLENYGITSLSSTALYEGSGVSEYNGETVPIPNPAVLSLLQQCRLPMKVTAAHAECLSALALAILASYAPSFAPFDGQTIQKVGIGSDQLAGTPKILRILLLEPPLALPREQVWVLETNVDDCSGELLGYTIEKLLAAGAKDACCLPLLMKKHRPAYLLQVLCDEAHIATMEDIIFHETTSIGLRKYQEERVVLSRSFETIHYEGESVSLKVCEHKGRRFFYPEYSDLIRLCEKTGQPYRQVYQAVLTLASDRQGNTFD